VSVDEARTYSAIALFLQRAEFEANFVVNANNVMKIVEICRRLDGVPRGIELAAARLAVLGLRDLHLRLNEHFVLTGGGHDLPAGKKTLLEGVVWSYNALTQVEQTLLCRLSVFEASHTLEDAEAVCVAEGVEQERVAEILESLVDKSLVVVNRASVTRYRVLDVVRSYCLERLSESGELAGLSQKYAQWCGTSRTEFQND
jgi:predicted ATPase